MKKLFLIFLCSLTLSATLLESAEARIVVGVTSSTAIDTADALGEPLGKSSGEEIKIRHFDNDAALTNWLIRFQEVDTAVVTASYIPSQPAGALQHLADVHRKSGTPLALVARSNINQKLATRIQNAFIALGSTDSGRKALATAGLTGASLPGKALKQQAAPQKPATLPPQPAIAVPPEPTKKPVEKQFVQPKEHKQAPVVKTAIPQPKPEPEEIVPSPPAQTKPRQTIKPKVSKVKKPVKKIASRPAPETAEKHPAVAPAPTQKASVKKPATGSPGQTDAKKPEPATQAPQEKQLPETKDQEKKTDKRLALFIALIVLAAILLKIALFAMRWQNRKQISSRPPDTPSIEADVEPEPSAPEEPPPFDKQADGPLVIETGHLGPGKVPALLKRCADLPEPVVLQVSKGSCEKLVYFAAGQVAGALTQNATTQESGVRWNKLGSMLLREEFITKEERDQGMSLLTREPGLRFGEALLKLGYISLAELRHALTRQAKITIYSLILFPEGRYKVFSEEGSLPPEESVSLEVTGLIREASHHQSEWMAIRESLPNLNTALEFSNDGRSKLEQVNISEPQEETLALIDGNRTINELCTESAMMDYEIYRFLYLMVKAGVLKQPQ